jgi:aspartyl-tRNA(Asn)/glutamyl-tRNA(Gln) amidotransferase subunit A
MNTDVADRAAPGLSVSAETYIHALWRHQELRSAGRRAMREVDAWIAPCKINLAPAFPGKYVSLEKDKELIALCAGPTRVANTFGLCALSQPVQQYGAELPVGMQIMCGGFDELRLLSIATAVEQVVGRPIKPDVSQFLDRNAAE